MKILFNGSVSGLGNNGGSRTILLSAQTIRDLGHECDILSPVDKFTWFEHKPCLKTIEYIPDILINIAAVDLKSTLSIPSKVKAWYIRAHENWAMSDKQLNELYKTPKVINIVNSIGLQKVLSYNGAKSDVVYQGIDFDVWKDKKLRPNNKIRIGGLYTKQPRKRWNDFRLLAEELGHVNYEYIGIGNSTPSAREGGFLTEYKCNATSEELSDIYSSCHIWFAPTDSEGLHNVPMEANLCGCLVVCSNHPLNGMVFDYAFRQDTAMVYQKYDILHAATLVRNPDWELIERMQKHIYKNIGDRKTNMKKLISLVSENDI